MLDNSSEKVGVQSGTAEEKGSAHSYCVFDQHSGGDSFSANLSMVKSFTV